MTQSEERHHDTENKDDTDWTRLARYLAHESPAEEVAAVEAWIAETPERRQMLASLTGAWDRAGRLQGPRHTDVDAAWLRMSARSRVIRAPVPDHWRTALRLAASLVIVAGGAALWRSMRESGSSGGSPARTISTTPGERRTVLLDDSTEVVLGVASRMVVSAGYGRPNREVRLAGEALFRVRHDAARPFRVHTLNGVAQDIGTEFAVRAYGAGSEPVRVVVLSGSVSLAREDAAPVPNGPAAVVHAGETGVLASTGAPTVSSTVNATAAQAFAHGELVFDDEPFSRVAVDLARWYGVTVEVASPTLSSRHLTAAFTNEPLDDVLRVVALSIGARYELRAQSVVFRAKGSP